MQVISILLPQLIKYCLSYTLEMHFFKTNIQKDIAILLIFNRQVNVSLEMQDYSTDLHFNALQGQSSSN